ncbi:hypothetical protein [Dokdonia sp. PRO95]|uniref:hypothetical protein n=1 Tax=Dokdonia sp. PRO95 TaxID=1239415 RepID=UPI000557CDA3|nr:hypothetical protein [Dokdonia sp. PRO95]
MRQILTFVILTTLCLSCTNSDDGNQRNPFLLDVNFSTQLSAIQVLDLEIPSNPIYVQNGGIRGLFVINTGSSIVAWEASDPNHAPNDCSLMVIDGINVKCQCDDDNSYNLFTGQSNNEVLEYTMLNYRVNASGNSITVFN